MGEADHQLGYLSRLALAIGSCVAFSSDSDMLLHGVDALYLTAYTDYANGKGQIYRCPATCVPGADHTWTMVRGLDCSLPLLVLWGCLAGSDYTKFPGIGPATATKLMDKVCMGPSRGGRTIRLCWTFVTDCPRLDRRCCCY